MQKPKIVFTGLLLAGALNTACGNGVAGFKVQSQRVPEEWTYEGVAKCEVEQPQYEIDSSVLSFEMVDSFSASFGFNGNVEYGPVDGKGTIKLNRVRLSVMMEAWHPFNGGGLKGTDRGEADQRQFSGNGEIKFEEIKTNPGYYDSTPLAQVSSNAIKNGLEKLAVRTKAEPWMGRIIQRVGQDFLVLNAGSSANIRVGDEFYAHNVQNVWAGNPCESVFRLSRRKSQSPVARMVVREVGAYSASLEAVEGNLDEVNMGAEVTIARLVKSEAEKSRPDLKKIVRVGSTDSRPIKLADGTFISFGELIAPQVKAEIFKSNSFVLEQY